MEQDKHRLRLQIEVMEDEYEQRIADLRTDLAKMRQDLADVEARHRDTERERTGLVSTLTEQNQRLTVELEAASKREEELQKKLTQMRAQFDDKRVTMRDHVLHLETLKDEVNIYIKSAAQLPVF